MAKTTNNLISAITMMTAGVVGVSKDGTRYDLPVIRVYTDDRSFSRIIEVDLPFNEEHQIWPELAPLKR